MTVREYIGARYVPLFMGDWDNTNTYEPLSIVSNEGNSYTSRQYVPTGIDISNEAYWAETGNYNAQVEAYRNEVLAFDGRITQNEEDISSIESSISTIESDIDTIESSITDIETEIASDVESLQTSITGIQTDISEIEADDWVTANRIADNAITTDKISDNSITPDKLSESFFKTYANFYTPEQFGAVGNGTTDDSQAFIDMLAAMPDYSLCVLQSREYLIKQPLTINQSFCSFTSLERSENKPALRFDFVDYTDTKCITCYGTGNNFSNIHFNQLDRASNSYMFFIDAYNNSYNVDYTIDNCVISNAWNAIGVVGRNLHVTNCLISTIAATSIVILQPRYATPLRGYVFDNNRFHVAGMLVNTTNITSYDEVFNLALVNNFVDFSKRLYLGISDNVNVSGNTVAQTTLKDDYLVVATTTIKEDSCIYVCNNMVNTIGSPATNNGPIAGLYSQTTNVGTLVNISNNMFDTIHDGSRAVVTVPSTQLNNVILISGNTIHTKGSGTPIQIVNSTGVVGLVTGNAITTNSSASFISAAGLTVSNNFTANVSF